jgi:hypothetical protein
MKLRILAALLLFSSVIDAQEWESRPTKSSVYVTAGGNYSGSVGWEDPSTSGAGYFAGFNAGLAFTGSINKRQSTQLNIEASFSQQGFRNKEVTIDGDPERLVLNYINVPVIVHHRPFKKFPNLYVGAGPQIGFQVGGHVKLKGGEKLELNDDAISKTTFSGVGVLGINFGMALNLGLEFSYHHGFTKFLENSPELKHSVVQAKLLLPVDFVSMLAAGM